MSGGIKSTILKLLLILLPAAVLLGFLLAAYLMLAPFARIFDGAYVSARMPEDLRGAYLYSSGDIFETWRLAAVGLTPAATGDFYKPSGSVSPDGTRIVYAYGSTTADVMPFASGRPIRPSEWTVVTRPADGTELTFVAKGYAPAFLDDRHIAFVSDGGLIVVDTVTKSHDLVFAFPEPTLIDSFVRYSPDRTTILWSQARTGDSILGTIAPGRFELIRAFTVSIPSHLLLTNTHLYSYWASEKGTDLTRENLDGSDVKHILRIPASLQVKSLMI